MYILLSDVYSLAILRLCTEMNHNGMSLMNWDVQDPPDGFTAADVSSQFILPNLIVHSPIHCQAKHSHVRSFVDILTHIFDGFGRLAVLNIDVCIE